MATEKQEKPYDGWLVSNNFWKRAFAIWGHYIVANAIFGLAMFILFLVFGLLTFGLFWNNSNVKSFIKTEITNNFMEEIKTGVTDHVDSVREHTEEIRNNSVSENNTQIANPASQNCVSLGGTIEITNEEAGQIGTCKKDGKSCEEWALFRGECSF